MRSTVKPRLPSLRLLLTTAATALVASLAFALSSPATISVDGQRLASDVGPVTTPGGTYLPLRAVADASGAQTSFDGSSGAVTDAMRGPLEFRSFVTDLLLGGCMRAAYGYTIPAPSLQAPPRESLWI